MLLSACPVLMITIRERISQIDPRALAHTVRVQKRYLQENDTLIHSAIHLVSGFAHCAFISSVQNPFARTVQQQRRMDTTARAEKRVKHTQCERVPCFLRERVCVGRTHCVLYTRALVLSRKALGIMQILTVYAPRREPNERDH